MPQVVSITSQGQMTIPAKMKRKLDLGNKALVRMKKKKLIVEPVGDILELGGVFKDKAMKGKTIDEVIKLEEKAVIEEMIKNEAKKE